MGDVEALPADERAAATGARLRVHLAQSGRRLSVNDLWIAATAVAHELPPVTRDDDFAPVDGVAGLRVVHA